MIEKAKFNEAIESFTLLKNTSVKSGEGADDSVAVTLKVKYEGVTIQQMAEATLGQGVVVKWQNGPGRKKHTSWKANQVVEVNFTAPASTYVDPKEQLLAEASAAGVDTESEDELKAYIIKRMGL